MNKTSLVIPLIAAGFSISCTTATDDPVLEVGAEVQVSASVQADIDGMAGVHIELSPADICDGYGETPPHAYGVDITQKAYPDGTPFGGPTDYTSVLLEARFEGVVPGCYDVVAVPIGADGEPLDACVSTTVPGVVDEYTSLIFDLPIQCGDVPRSELDITTANFEPHIDMITAEPMVSACEATVVCATARDADFDMLEFEWPQPDGLTPNGTAPWPTIVNHRVNPDRSVTQCIAVQARDSGNYDVGVTVYDLYRTEPGLTPVRIEDRTGVDSHAIDSVAIDATLGCEPTGRSAVILLTLDNDPGLAEADATTLVGNTVRWVSGNDGVGTAAPSILVVLDDNHHGEDQADGQYVAGLLESLDYQVDYELEPSDGLVYSELTDYDLVWFVNPGHEMDDPATHTALLRYRATGGGLVLQGDDMARFRGNPTFMEPLTYLSWQGNGTNACGVRTDNNEGESYTVSFELPTSDPHPMAAGIERLSFPYGNDIDLTRPLGKGERVLAWASFAHDTCEVRTPAVVALEPDELLAWE